MSSTHTGKSSSDNILADADKARDKLVGDLKNVINEAEGWLDGAKDQTGDNIKAVKERFIATVETAKKDLIKLEEDLLDRTKKAAKATDEYVQDNPWKAVGAGAVVGVLFGLLLSSSRR
ncbi:MULTISPECIES: DUF883 family protein [unclassified Janthinobacterium]|uniref:glycine zipper domain-containing protein n=1 Tax=unclassified Janthinobacterium TaxID=2610881 RepID=UPI000886D3BB|nr:MULTISPECIES: DUF883 family protein [unclassified Janthinobacterium]SDA83206.1 Membrane-anchored ribosome-binding protein, inhibits growth in stationary phase, ElaB/YqjD/DUF883 family [Janthinobacterium sp. 551a]SFB10634.1 Membrane-anchored ribosome-binding protein, inhibits growth in stationary phase, ElaB/YqjD/DUF883 family [Janthinobacterium sp. 344]